MNTTQNTLLNACQEALETFRGMGMSDHRVAINLEAVISDTERGVNETGELGLPFSEAGSVLQALAKVLEDRGHEDVRENLPDESEFWDTFGGPMVDELGEYMGIGAFPEDKEDPR